MSANVRAVLSYWRGSLIDATRTIDPTSLTLYETDFHNVARGKLRSETKSLLWKDAGPSKGTGQESGTQRSIPVLVAPVKVEPHHEHGAVRSTFPRLIIPVWIEALLNTNGCLLAERAFVDRAVMSPMGSNKHVYVSMASVDCHLDKRGELRLSHDESDWKEFWSRFRSWFEDLFGRSVESWQPEGMVRSTGVAYDGRLRGKPAQAIQEVYEQLQSQEPLPPLLTSLVTRRIPVEIGKSEEHRQAKATAHWGQMGGEISTQWWTEECSRSSVGDA